MTNAITERQKRELILDALFRSFHEDNSKVRIIKKKMIGEPVILLLGGIDLAAFIVSGFMFQRPEWVSGAWFIVGCGGVLLVASFVAMYLSSLKEVDVEEDVKIRWNIK